MLNLGQFWLKNFNGSKSAIDTHWLFLAVEKKSPKSAMKSKIGHKSLTIRKIEKKKTTFTFSTFNFTYSVPFSSDFEHVLAVL